MTIRVGNTIIATVNKNADGGNGGGLEVGDIGFAPLGIDETQNKRRYLNGQVISQSQFESFTSWVKERTTLYPSLVTSETNWQAEVTNSKLGQCGKFVIDDELGTIRLPKVVNIQGSQDLTLIGNIKDESLPNITGKFHIQKAGEAQDTGGAFTSYTYGARNSASTASTGSMIDFDASRVSSTYQDNAPVQQEAIQYPYFIQVATSVEESIDVTREIELNNPFSLLDYKWSEYEISNASWLLSNGQFNSGATYISVYNLLLEIYNNTVTKDGVSVKLSTEEYTDTDFVLNTVDTTFRLPIKVKLASGNAVVGNGVSLGLTDGTNYAAATTGSVSGSTFLYPRVESYGLPIGGTDTTANQLTNNTSLGVTTDPTKSGIETSSQDLYLYFYIGETIQDANVIAASQVLTTVASLKSYAIGTPDYSAGVVKALNIEHTAETAGLIIGKSDSYLNNTGILTINSVEYHQSTAGPVYGNSFTLSFFVDRGDVYKLNFGELIFYPLKGIN